MLAYLFQHLVLGFFAEQGLYATHIKPHSLSTNLWTWKMGGSMYWLSSLDRVPCINALSQRSQYVEVPGDGGGGGGGRGSGPALGIQIGIPGSNPVLHWE